MTDETMFHGANELSKKKRVLELSERDVRAARRLLGLIGDAEDDNVEVRHAVPIKTAVDPNTSVLLARARIEFENRRRRTRFFGQSMFGEPGWDMLLALYLQHAAGPRQTLGRLLQLSGLPPSTGKRWLDVLSEEGLVMREAHPYDARTYFVRLTKKAHELLDAHFSETTDSSI